MTIEERLQRMRNPDKMSEQELRAVVKAWRRGLSEICCMDYRGNRPAEQVAAEKLLEVAEL
jgi:hypothetical protein